MSNLSESLGSLLLNSSVSAWDSWWSLMQERDDIYSLKGSKSSYDFFNKFLNRNVIDRFFLNLKL